MLVTSTGTPAKLSNNPNARNRPLVDVLKFVQANTVNRRFYKPGAFMCTEYAIALNDAAEANGFRCALVSLGFREGIGHALNAFETTDHGLVYIDCTGGPAGDNTDDFDTVGYIQIGRSYGRLHLELGSRSPVLYRHYEDARTIFRNLGAWDIELAAEHREIEQAQRSLMSQLSRASRETLAQVRAAHAALNERINRYNRDIEYRNDLARTFRVQYSENKSPVSRVDTFW